MFNCNELPSDVEHTHAFFRRFLIIPFEVTIPATKQKKDFAQKIIHTELSGVFNWVLNGLQRVLRQKEFTQCDPAANRNKQFRHDSDSVLMFLSERRFEASLIKTTPLKELYGKYTSFCKADRHHPVAKNTFSKRFVNVGYKRKKESQGMAFYLIHK
jgi:putative DNA primase/helicase